jgi:hypothetical protein
MTGLVYSTDYSQNNSAAYLNVDVEGSYFRRKYFELSLAEIVAKWEENSKIKGNYSCKLLELIIFFAIFYQAADSKTSE